VEWGILAGICLDWTVRRFLGDYCRDDKVVDSEASDEEKQNLVV
jgi:hypothetical protein